MRPKLQGFNRHQPPSNSSVSPDSWPAPPFSSSSSEPATSSRHDGWSDQWYPISIQGQLLVRATNVIRLVWSPNFLVVRPQKENRMAGHSVGLFSSWNWGLARRGEQLDVAQLKVLSSGPKLIEIICWSETLCINHFDCSDRLSIVATYAPSMPSSPFCLALPLEANPNLSFQQNTWKQVQLQALWVVCQSQVHPIRLIVLDRATRGFCRASLRFVSYPWFDLQLNVCLYKE